MSENNILSRITNFLGFKTFEEQDVALFQQEETVKSFATPSNEDGAIVNEVYSAHCVLPYQAVPGIKNTRDLIDTYRATSLIPEVDHAIEDIVNQSIVTSSDDEVVRLNIDDTKFSDGVKTKIQEEFDCLLNLLDFQQKAEEYFRDWYIDSRLIFHKMIDSKKPERGILEFRKLDPRTVEKLRIIEKETVNNIDVVKCYKDFFVYTPLTGDTSNLYVGSSQGQTLQIPASSITFCHSGLKDKTGNNLIGYLDQSIRPANQLRMLEDAAIIYRISRAPERRVFYIDVGNLPKTKAEQYVNNIMNRFKNKIVYNSKTGSVKNEHDTQSILEDYWLPRKEGSKGTQIETLDGGSTQGINDELKYYKDNLYESLRTPKGRFHEDSSSVFNIATVSEISREERRFDRFTKKLQIKFSPVLIDPLKTQLLLKKIITESDWEDNKDKIRIQFLSDTYLDEMRENEVLQSRIDLAQSLKDYVGIYFSHDTVMKRIFKQNEDEMKEEAKKIEEEKKDDRFQIDTGY